MPLYPQQRGHSRQNKGARVATTKGKSHAINTAEAAQLSDPEGTLSELGGDASSVTRRRHQLPDPEGTLSELA